MRFSDRAEAGQLLAEKLERYREERPIVLGLTRGGVPVALEIALRLGATLDVMVVRKIGAPFQPEYALGAVAEGGGAYVDAEAVQEVGLDAEDVAALAEPELRELSRRIGAFHRGGVLPEVAGRTVLIVDDGVATGATARAACRSARARGAARVVLAAPVIAAQTEPKLRAECDDVVAVELPTNLVAVGGWYRRFSQVSDDEVLGSLERARSAVSGDLWDGEWVEGEQDANQRWRPPSTQHEVRIALGDREAALQGFLALPPAPLGLVLFVHGSGSSRHSPRNQWVARVLQREALATLLFDLLTPEEAREDERTGRLRFDIERLARRVGVVSHWIAEEPRVRDLPLGYFGASTGAAAALAAAAPAPGRVAAIVSRGGRPDLVPAAALQAVTAPVLLLVGERDEEVLELNRQAAAHLPSAQVVLVPGASHLFEEPGALSEVAQCAATWFAGHFSASQATASGSHAPT
jgi:putative phosphoribosyl transferase